MPFNRVALYISRQASMPIKQLHTAEVEMLYSSFLKGESFAGYHSINFFFTSLPMEDGLTLRQGHFIDFYILFDFLAFNRLEVPQERKQYLLHAIHEAALRLAHQEAWAIERFELAYQSCMSCDLRVEWNFRHKLFLAPDKAHYFSLFHQVDFDKFEIAEVLYDKRKQEIFRRQCFVDATPTFSVQWAAWENSNWFSYRFSGPKQVFNAEIAELLQHQEYRTSRRQKDLF